MKTALTLSLVTLLMVSSVALAAKAEDTIKCKAAGGHSGEINVVFDYYKSSVVGSFTDADTGASEQFNCNGHRGDQSPELFASKLFFYAVNRSSECMADYIMIEKRIRKGSPGQVALLLYTGEDSHGRDEYSYRYFDCNYP